MRLTASTAVLIVTAALLSAGCASSRKASEHSSQLRVESEKLKVEDGRDSLLLTAYGLINDNDNENDNFF